MTGTVREINVDVAVMGGGVAGICAALAAARMGCTVALVQDRAVLGGNASSEIRMNISGAEALIRRLKDGLDYRETGILEELRLEEAVRNPQRSASMQDLIFWEAVRNEPRLTLLLNTTCDGAETVPASLPPAPELVATGVHGPGQPGPTRRILCAHASRPSTEERFAIYAKYFIDATGDGRLGAEAGADFRYGREGRDDYGEPLAIRQADCRVLGSSLLFTARRHDRPMPFSAPGWARKFTEEDLRFRPHGSLDFGYWWIEWGGQLDTIADNEVIRDELLAIAMGVWDHMKNGGDHGAENWALDWIGFLPGKRESRRFLGDHVLTQADVQHAPLFPDRVAYGGWPIDTHPPAGIDQTGERPCTQIGLEQPFSIPLRSLYSRNVVNMLMAGRDISASHIAFASTRVMGTCALIGQAAGTAAAVAAASALPAARSCLDEPYLERIQQQLLRDDAYLVELAGSDPADLAKEAAVGASSYITGGEPCQVTNGMTRRTRHAQNMWISQDGLPQRLWLSWAKPVAVHLVELTMDTGLHRELRLSMSEEVAERSIRGPQPETMADFSLRLYRGEELLAERAVVGNYQRKLRIHLGQAYECSRIELEMQRAWGTPNARLFEVRAYERPAV